MSEHGDPVRPVRWVQYDVPLFVRVQADEDGWGTEIPKVILVTDPEHMDLARDFSGHFLVYDESFEPVGDDVRLDGIRGAVSAAEDKHRWPDPDSIVVLGEGWLTGPDPRDHPDYYLGDGVFDARDAEDAAWEAAELAEAEDQDG